MSMRVQEIKDAVKKMGGGPVGKAKFLKYYMEPLLEGKELANGLKLKPVPPEDWSLRALWEGLVGDLGDTLPVERFFESTYYESALDSTMFPKATGNLILRKVIEGYNKEGYIGDQLVENMPSNLRSETIPGFTSTQGPKEVAEGNAYEESSIGEKYVTTATSKKGRLISLTEETIYLDKTGQIMRRALMIGEATRQEREEVILNGVTGVTSTVYRPSGVAATLYAHATHANLNDSNTLADWSSIDNALQYHAANIKDDRQGETQKPIMWNPKIILCGPELVTTARRIVGATEIRALSNTNNTTLSTNPFSGFQVLSTTLWPTGLTAGDWFIGDPVRQFVWHEVWPLQTFAQGASSETAFERDVVMRAKVRYWGGIAAVDHRYVIKNTVA